MNKIYVASSWRNQYQPIVVRELKNAGFIVYNYRDPNDNRKTGFQWSDIDVDWGNWSQHEYKNALTHPIAVDGFKTDYDAMVWADIFVLVCPSGTSSHLELGWAIGMSKPSIIFIPEPMEPELMYKLADHVALSLDKVKEIIKSYN